MRVESSYVSILRTLVATEPRAREATSALFSKMVHHGCIYASKEAERVDYSYWLVEPQPDAWIGVHILDSLSNGWHLYHSMMKTRDCHEPYQKVKKPGIMRSAV